ncbi:MAG TPA: hypothetical protein VGR43_03780 [Dehalococcoidia bacterium]|jgi:hypothetical protein|nr:hypothetical protein [Dehalococcoidia bacterium]
MGFYHGSWRRSLSSEDVSPNITPREYVLLFADAMQTIIRRSLQDLEAHGLDPSEAEVSARIDALSRRLRHRPDDSLTHRMMAIAQAQGGNSSRAIRHFEIAINILVTKATSGCTRESLCARMELARLLPALAPLSRQRGRRQVGRRLLDAVLLDLVGGC